MAREESEVRREKLLQRKAKVEIEKQKARTQLYTFEVTGEFVCRLFCFHGSQS